MKSTLFNMVMVLFVITLLASAGVGAVHMITEEPIAEARVKATREALKQVLPEFDETEDTALTVENLPVTVHTASEKGRVVGYAVESMTKNGFSGVIRLMVGFAPDGQILNIRVLEQAETPGLGTKMVDAGNPLEKSFVGRNPAQMKLGVKKDGGDVDALTAATISSRAYVDAVSRAYKAYCEKAGVEAAVNTVSGASNTQNAGATVLRALRLPGMRERMVRPVLRTIKKRERKPRRARRLLGRMQRLGRELRVKSGIESGDWSVKAVPTASSEEVRP